MTETTALATTVQTALDVYPRESPREIVNHALEYAEVLAEVINKKHLFTDIKGKKYVRVEGWQLLGSFVKVSSRECGVTHDGKDFEANVELVDDRTGIVVGRGSSTCGQSDKAWRGREPVAQRSMAVTRAIARAYRNKYSWIMAMTDFEVTPMEEMESQQTSPDKPFNIENPEDVAWFKEQPDVKMLDDMAHAKKIAALLHGRPRADLDVVIKQLGTPKPATDFEVT